MNHYRKTVHKYRARLTSDGCPFCDPATIEKAIFENNYIYIVPNLTQYDLWELYDVTDHVLIIPKRHIEALSELDDNERLAIMDAAADYDLKGYSMYARGIGFINRSVAHQHTHLIKAANRKPKIALFVGSPYFLFKK